VSLVKTYTVGCEGPALTDRLRQLNRLKRVQVSYREHVPFSGYATSSAKTRRSAIANGWTRVTVTLPLFNNRPDGDATDVKFDLCPSCTAMLKGAL
jgi:hypothetical protein